MRPPPVSKERYWLQEFGGVLCLCAVCEECGYLGTVKLAPVPPSE